MPTGNDVKPLLRFIHANQNDFCLSHCSKPELRDLVRLFKKVEERTWTQIYATSGKGQGKRGLGYEPVSPTSLPPLPATLSDDIQPFELRVSDVGRIFAFRDEGDACAVLFFDPRHRILRN